VTGPAAVFHRLKIGSHIIIHELSRRTIKDLMYTTIKQNSLAKGIPR
jgi:hypothetical protein